MQGSISKTVLNLFVDYKTKKKENLSCASVVPDYLSHLLFTNYTNYEVCFL